MIIAPSFRDNFISYLGEGKDTPTLDYEIPEKKVKMEVIEPKPVSVQAAPTPTPGCYMPYSPTGWPMASNNVNPPHPNIDGSSLLCHRHLHHGHVHHLHLLDLGHKDGHGVCLLQHLLQLHHVNQPQIVDNQHLSRLMILMTWMCSFHSHLTIMSHHN